MSGPALIPQVLVAQKKAGTSFASFTTAKSIINPEDVVPISAPWMQVGLQLEIYGLLAMSNVVTTQPTWTLSVNIGATAVFTADTFTSKSTASSALPFEFEIKLRLDSIGATSAAKFIGNGRYNCAAFTVTQGLLQAATPAVGTGFGSTAGDGSANIDLFMACQTSNASNAVQVFNYRVLMTQY